MLKKSILLFTLLAIGVGIYFYLFVNQKSDLSEGFAVGNGRVETTQVDVASKLSGRLIDIDAEEGDLVQKDEILAHIDTKELNAKLQEAIANKQQAVENKNYTIAIVEQKQSELALIQKNYNRALSLYNSKSIALEE